MAEQNGKLSPVQRKMLDLLADGLPHSRLELHACLWDELSEGSAVSHHLSCIRKSLRPQGQDVLCELANGEVKYRQVRLLCSNHE